MSLKLGDTVPDFAQRSTAGWFEFYDWAGENWVVLFSHPKDFTPVCTTELGAVAALKSEFDRRGVKVVGLSVDPVDSHERWAKDIAETQGHALNFPLIADHDRKVSTLLDLIHPGASDTTTVRTVLVIDPAKKLRLTLTYPASTGRNFAEILRTIDSLQLTDRHKVATPADWQQGDDVIIVPSVDDDAACALFPDGWRAIKPYLHGQAAVVMRGREAQGPKAVAAVRRTSGRVEWPTLGIAAAIYGGWILLTAMSRHLPWPLLAAAGGWLVAWHGSLQHETIHGHPTRSRAVNDAIGFVPLSLWLPYAIYRRDHLAHHSSPWITHPHDDPESRYLLTNVRGWVWLAHLQRTLFGRLVLGPLCSVIALVREEGRRLQHAPRAVLQDWGPHLVAVAALVLWIEAIGLGLISYLLLFVYPGMALTLLRSFAEHRADIPGPSRAVTVERGGLLGLLFLNNHFHVAHHERPGLPWYRLPAYQRHHRRRLSGAGTVTYSSYGAIVRRFAFRGHHQLYHPAAEAVE
jgi:alkyl hydroperoxide reductase subunit AhpC/fatty acid desaturase